MELIPGTPGVKPVKCHPRTDQVEAAIRQPGGLSATRLAAKGGIAGQDLLAGLAHLFVWLHTPHSTAKIQEQARQQSGPRADISHAPARAQPATLYQRVDHLGGIAGTAFYVIMDAGAEDLLWIDSGHASRGLQPEILRISRFPTHGGVFPAGAVLHVLTLVIPFGDARQGIYEDIHIFQCVV